jgi:hypothetical protein
VTTAARGKGKGKAKALTPSVQDDGREWELCRTFNLSWDPSHARGGEDASMIVTVDGLSYRLGVEVKSTTGDTVSTARDVSPDHIRRWRSMFFVIGFYSVGGNRPHLIKSLCLSPVDMEPWIASIAKMIEPDFKIAQLASRRLELDDLFEVCGRKDAYTIEDARLLHKMQWSISDYMAAADMEGPDGVLLSPESMLSVLRSRSKYIAERGATLNNPHITKTFLKAFWGTDREVQVHQSAEGIRRLAEQFISANPGHAASVRVA